MKVDVIVRRDEQLTTYDDITLMDGQNEEQTRKLTVSK